MSFGRRAHFHGCDHVLERRHMHDDAAEVEFTSSGDQLPIGHAPAVAIGHVGQDVEIAGAPYLLVGAGPAFVPPDSRMAKSAEEPAVGADRSMPSPISRGLVAPLLRCFLLPRSRSMSGRRLTCVRRRTSLASLAGSRLPLPLRPSDRLK